MSTFRAYLDSCVVIYLIEGPDPVSRAVREALRPETNEAPTAVISDLTRLECRVAPLRDGESETLARYDSFFAASDLLCLPL